MSKLRAIARSFGPPQETVVCESYEPPSPGPGQVRVRMLLASINPSDLITASGAYPSRTSLPHIPGFEGVGVIESVGPGVHGSVIGQRVLPIGSSGAWQDVKVTDECWCFPVPADMTDQQAAMGYVNPLSALRMVREYGPVASAPVAVNAATSAIGQMIIRMLNLVGIQPIALVRRPESKKLFVGKPGISSVLCSSEPGVRRQLYELSNGHGLAVAWDAVGGAEGEELAQSLAPGGKLVHYGLLSGLPLSPSLYQKCPGVQIVLFRLRDWVHSAERNEIQSALNECFEMVRDDIAASKVAVVFPLSEIQQALEYPATPGRKPGKILLSMNVDAS